MEGLIDPQVLASVVRASVPLLLAALGGMVCERAGIFQISLEGMMLVGAFAAVAGSFFGTAATGVLAAIAAGMALSVILAFGVVSRQGNPIVIGIALNLLAVGLTAFLLGQVFGVRGVFRDPAIDGFATWIVPGLVDIPVIGEAMFAQSLLGYAAFLAVPVVWWALYRTPLGLRLRGVGELPDAALTLGVSPTRYQYGAVLFSGAAAGLAGAQLALANVVQFADGMSAGRGWIAVVAVMLGRAHPVGVFGAVLLFGAAEAIGFRLQGVGMAAQVTDALPYVVTLVALFLARKRFTKLLNIEVKV